MILKTLLSIVQSHILTVNICHICDLKDLSMQSSLDVNFELIKEFNILCFVENDPCCNKRINISGLVYPYECARECWCIESVCVCVCVKVYVFIICICVYEYLCVDE